MAADFWTSITIKGTDDELLALLKVLRIYVVDKYEQYQIDRDCGYLEYPHVLIANDDGGFDEFYDDEYLDEDEELTDDYLLSVIENAHGCIKIEANGPYGVFNFLEDVGLFDDMVKVAPLTFIDGRMSGFSTGGDDEYSVTLKDGLVKWNGGPQRRVAVKKNSSIKEIDGWLVKKSKDGWTLVGCNILNEIVDIPENLEGKPITKIGKEAFFGLQDKSVKKILVPKTITKIEKNAFGEVSSSDVDDMDPWGGCYDDMPQTLEIIEVDEENPNYCSIDGMLLDKAKSQILYCPVKIKGTIVIPASIKKLAVGQFANRVNIERVIIGEGLKSIEAFAFNRCSFKEIVIPGNVKTIGKYAFMESDIEKVVLEDGVKKLEEAFWMSSLKEIHIPDSVNYIANEAFGFLNGSEIMGFPEKYIASEKSYAGKYYAKYLDGSLVESLKATTQDDDWDDED